MTDTNARLKALRAQLGDLDGFLVPRSDLHQGEEVAARDERLAWISGFTGSAGYALILKDSQHLFVDGRYTTQGASQAPGFVQHDLHTDGPAKFLTAAHGRIGFDPWLMTPGQLAAFSGVTLVPMAENPIDAAWVDQPEHPAGEIWQHPVELAGKSSADKRREIGKAIADAGSDYALLTLPDSVAWLLNWRGRDLANTPVIRALALIAADGTTQVALVQPERVPGEILSDGVSAMTPRELLAKLATLKGAVLLDPATAPYRLFALCAETGVKVVEGRDPVILPKACKNAAELEGMRAAHRRDAVAMKAFLDWLPGAVEKGLSETAASDHLQNLRAQTNGYLGDSFDAISAAGANAALPHYRAEPGADAQLQPGNVYLIDSGGQYVDGTTDITRTIALGEVRQEIKQAFTAVLKGHIALAVMRFPRGTSGQALDAFARQHLWQLGLEFDHGTGHGVGAVLNVHEGPAVIGKISPVRPSVPLVPGMVLSNEPGYYVPGDFGMRFENLMIVIEAEELSGQNRPFYAFETITFTPVDMSLVLTDQLTATEMAWLEWYHGECERVLAG